MEQPTAQHVDILVKTGASPGNLQETLDALPGIVALVEDTPHPDGRHRVRVLEGLSFLEFAFAQQGYGEVEKV